MNAWIENGLHIELNGLHVVADSDIDESADFGLISHAHADHLPSTSSGGPYICSDITHSLCKQRVGVLDRIQDSRVELINSGHIPGSKATLIEAGGNSVLYTGDFSVRDRFHLDGFEPVSADYLIIESTYGHPRYEFDEQESLESEIVEWFEKSGPKVCKGYSLGRAQEIEELARRAGRDEILVNQATKNINSCLNEFGSDFSTTAYDGEISESGVLITSNSKQFESVGNGVDSAVFTGWASDGRYQSQDNPNRGFVLSDHCDFSELISVVEQVEPDEVYTIHGYKDRFAKEIKKRTGIKATSLKEGQRTLGEF